MSACATELTTTSVEDSNSQVSMKERVDGMCVPAKRFHLITQNIFCWSVTESDIIRVNQFVLVLGIIITVYIE